MKKKLKIAGLLTLMLIGGCGDLADEDQTNEGLTVHDTTDIKQLVHDYSIGKLKNDTASITSEQLIVTHADASETIYELPKDEFFVSFAPYINQTHPCTTHSLTGCQGELVDEEMTVRIEDKNGNVVFDEKTKTQANGFIDFWLPKNEEYHMTVVMDEKTATLDFSTFTGDNTCITTLQLG